MRTLQKMIKRYGEESKYYDSIWQRIYLSDWFDHFYRIYKKPFQIAHTITKFFYYGYHGTKCYDFEASSIHDLMYAHMKRVNKFMRSDKTHLQWNDNNDTKGMKLLAEFTELSKRMSEDELRSSYYSSKVRAKYPNERFINSTNETYQRDMMRAYKKDQKTVDQLTKRYYYLLETKLYGFWD